MIRRMLTIVLLAGSAGAWAAGAGNGLMHADANVHDVASVQRGAALFMNYCHSCHSAQYMRYQRLANDLSLPEEEVEEYLIFGNLQITDYMIAAMDPAEATDWLGAPPPDLTLTARSRGADWVYSFLNGFYLTDDGWNNTVLTNPSMPHVLWDLQGIQRELTETYVDGHGQERSRLVGLELDEPGRMNESEYRRATRDITAFMVYLAEPAVLKRERIGIWVLLFIGVFTFLSWLLYKEYWKDVK